MNDENSRKWLILPYCLIVAVAAARLSMVFPFNFVPIFSCLLFFGAKRKNKELALACAVFIGVDIFLTKIKYGYPLSVDHAVTWLWYGAALIAGAKLLRRSYTLQRVFTGLLSTAISFFVVSNLAVWMAWQLYPKTWAGLGSCYIAALPFFRNSLFSEVLATGMVFAVVRLLEIWREITLSNRIPGFNVNQGELK